MSVNQVWFAWSLYISNFCKGYQHYVFLFLYINIVHSLFCKYTLIIMTLKTYLTYHMNRILIIDTYQGQLTKQNHLFTTISEYFSAFVSCIKPTVIY